MLFRGNQKSYTDIASHQVNHNNNNNNTKEESRLAIKFIPMSILAEWSLKHFDPSDTAISDGSMANQQSFNDSISAIVGYTSIQANPTYCAWQDF